MNSSPTRLFVVGLIAISLMAFELQGFGAVRTTPGRFDASGLEGSGHAAMQPVNVGLRTGLVAAVPGSSSKEAWAIGRSTARIPGWAGDVGQTVFLRYTQTGGWTIVGPPVDSNGTIQNPNLQGISITSRAGGWAVGDAGAIYRLDGGGWVKTPKVTDSLGVELGLDLTSVSVGDGFGYAIGSGSTILILEGNVWKVDTVLSIPGEDNFELISISASSRDHAWAVGSSGGAILIFRRDGGGWQRVTTGQSLFDDPGLRRSDESATSIIATKAFAVSVTPDGAWIGGTILPSLDPTVAVDDPAGDVTRPFVIYFTSRGTKADISYCPDEYTIGSDRKAKTVSFCNQPLPQVGFGINVLQAFGGSDRGEVFAGGLGLFHYRGGEWMREPNPISSISSLSFSTPTEGWIAGSGNTYGSTGSTSSIGTLGHWTKSPASHRMARWPQPITDNTTLSTQPLESVAIAPDASGRALAVGQRGAMVLFQPGIGWDSFGILTSQALHSVSWPAGGKAWAVGGLGTIASYNGSSWSLDPKSQALTTASLFGVAFSRGSEGYAVGANGVILAYSNGEWSRDPDSTRITTNDLYAIDSAGDEFIAVGANGTILTNRDGRWSKREGLEKLLARGSQLPALYAVDGLPDGAVVVGGELSTLIRRVDGEWRVDREGNRVPPEGTILALAARRSGSTINMYASVSYERLKYSGENPGAVTGFVLYGTPTGWRDLAFSTRMTTHPSFDASAVPDPVLDIAVEGTKAWAVGGTGIGNDDAQGHVQSFPTSSIYRIDLNSDPRPTGHTVTPYLDNDPQVVSFAFFGESACGRGLCSAAMGTGIKADVVALQIRDEINAMSRLPGGPKFVIFGGNMRRNGIPEEIGEFKRFADGFRIPVYGAIGPQDLFSYPPSIGSDVQAPIILDNARKEIKGATDDKYYLEALNDRPRPWGRGALPSGFNPIETDVSARDGEARTHYAFDFVEGGKRLRIAIIDDSNVGRIADPNTQNPPENQKIWLEQNVLGNTPPNTATVLVMNRPFRDALETGGAVRQHPDPSVAEIQLIAATKGASAVLASYFRENSIDVIDLKTLDSRLSGTTAAYIFGGGGAPLEAKVTKPPIPSLGYYHSYQIVSVNFDPARRKPPLGQSEVYVRSYPVVDTVALHAIDGTTVPGGYTLRFNGSGRVVDGGGPGDPLQSRAVVLPFDLNASGVCPPDVKDKNRPKCQALIGGPIGPQFEFSSDNTKIGYFVLPSIQDPQRPALDSKLNPIPSSTSGLFCAVGAGQTYVSIISGFHRARMKVTVTGGFGPCVKEPVIDPTNPVVIRPSVVLQLPLGKAHFQANLRPPISELQPIAIVIPPTVPVVAPAPPAAGGYAKREEHEEAQEHQGSDFVAIRHRSNHERATLAAIRSESDKQDDSAILTATSFGAAFMGLFLTLLAAMVVRRRREAQQNGLVIVYSDARRRRS